VTAMPLDRKVRLFTMGWCLDCHRQQRDRPETAALAAEAPHAAAGRAIPEPGSRTEPIPQLETCSACHR
jgi:hypothetical protein